MPPHHPKKVAQLPSNKTARNQSVYSMIAQSILITGGTGLVGTRLSELLAAQGHTVTHLSRNPKQGKYKTYRWDIKKKYIDEEAITSADAIIHLAGAGVADQRWSEARKKEIYDSRIDSTKLLRDYVKKYNPELGYFLSASAIGYYGWDTGASLVDETSAQGKDFLAHVVVDWEKEAARFHELNIKAGIVRVGVVLSSDGGALVEIAKPIRLWAGAPLGSGTQYMSWIHLNDLCGVFMHCLENTVEGVVNGVAPNPTTNSVLTKAIANKLKKPLFLPNVPKFALKLMVGEMAAMLLGGNKVSSKKIEQLGYKFSYPDLNTALENLL